MSLTSDLKAGAVARGLFPDNATVTAAAAFALVRDMPYERASARAPETTIAEWRGTCSGKHYLLQALFTELGLSNTLIACTHEFTAQSAPWLPADLRAEVERAPVADVHMFLRVQPFPNTERADEWMTVDATWPMAGTALGLPVNEHFELGRDQQVACDPIEVFHVPEDTDPQALKDQLTALHAAGQLERRERFIVALTEWLGRAARPA
ncbi:MAG: hypothetical protein O2843_04030 [Chloroflexi bacterium]|nr:hypothetical protein [Chloroflexota bacterium]